MDIFGRDAVIGDYRLIDHGLQLASFSFEDNGEIGMGMDSEEFFLGTNPVPKYVGSKFDSKLTGKMSVIKAECITGEIYFNINEIREILSQLTGYQGYKRLYIYSNGMLENIYYNIRVTNVSMEKAGGRVVGLVFDIECDSQFAWYDERYEYSLSANETFEVFNNSDDKFHYLLPKIIITDVENATDFQLTNITDNQYRVTSINEISSGETVVIDSKLCKITSDIAYRDYASEFNFIFPRLVGGTNEIVVTNSCTITFDLKLPRKVGWM